MHSGLLAALYARHNAHTGKACKILVLMRTQHPFWAVQRIWLLQMAACAVQGTLAMLPAHVMQGFVDAEGRLELVIYMFSGNSLRTLYCNA